MNKTDFVRTVAKKSGLSLKDAKNTVDVIFDTRPKKGIIATELAGGRKVVLPGFGTFERRRRKARTGRNPQTGAKMKIPAKKYPAFKPGKNLKGRIK
jgi:DNA-binding protein HU-beta